MNEHMVTRAVGLRVKNSTEQAMNEIQQKKQEFANNIMQQVNTLEEIKNNKFAVNNIVETINYTNYDSQVLNCRHAWSARPNLTPYKF